MKRTLFIVVALVAFVFATTAGAATLSVVSNKTTYSPGETITLNVSGDGQGASSYAVFGRLQYTGAGGVTAVTQTQKLVGSAWTSGSVGNGAGFSDSFNQIAGLAALTATSLPTKNPFSTITLLAGATGTVNVAWNVVSGSGFELSFFGLTNAPGTSFTIIPEPTTAALLGLGLVGLTLGGRRRRE
jgi:hypothetical protein